MNQEEIKNIIRENITKLILKKKSDKPTSSIPFLNEQDDTVQNEIIFLIGLPGSGKSTYISKIKQQHPEKNYVVLSTDDIIEREAQKLGLNYTQVFDTLDRDETNAEFFSNIKKAVEDKKNIIIDRTNISKETREEILNLISLDYKKIAIIFKVPEKELQKRLKNREDKTGKHIPPEVIQKMSDEFEQPDKKEFDEIKVLKESWNIMAGEAIAKSDMISKFPRFGINPRINDFNQIDSQIKQQSQAQGKYKEFGNEDNSEKFLSNATPDSFLTGNTQVQDNIKNNLTQSITEKENLLKINEFAEIRKIIKETIEDVLDKESEHYDSIDANYGISNINKINKEIRIFSQEGIDKFKKAIPLWDKIYIQFVDNIGDALGRYKSGTATSSPVILISEKDIIEASEEYNVPIKTCVLTTIYHELGHAMVEYDFDLGLDILDVFEISDNEEDYVEDFAYNFFNFNSIPDDVKKLLKSKEDIQEGWPQKQANPIQEPLDAQSEYPIQQLPVVGNNMNTDAVDDFNDDIDKTLHKVKLLVDPEFTKPSMNYTMAYESTDFVRKLIRTVLNEGRYDRITGIVIDNLWKFIKYSKTEFDEDPDENDLQAFDLKGFKDILEFDLRLIIKREYDIGPPFIIEANTYESSIEFYIEIDPDWEPEAYNELNSELQNAVRHEVEHLTQFGVNVMQQKFMPLNKALRDEINANPYRTYEYLTLPDEIPAMVQGLYRKAKTTKQPLDVMMNDYLSLFNLSKKNKKLVFNTWLDFAKKNVPAAQYSKKY